jgi:NTP pyrophosphatase (non-canonical NTP hydrolase)
MNNHLLYLVTKERERQDAKWGVQDHDDYVWLAILVEEVGEAAKAILEGGMATVEKEVVQIIAVCMAWLENRERWPE